MPQLHLSSFSDFYFFFILWLKCWFFFIIFWLFTITAVRWCIAAPTSDVFVQRKRLSSYYWVNTTLSHAGRSPALWRSPYVRHHNTEQWWWWWWGYLHSVGLLVAPALSSWARDENKEREKQQSQEERNKSSKQERRHRTQDLCPRALQPAVWSQHRLKTVGHMSE